MNVPVIVLKNVSIRQVENSQKRLQSVLEDIVNKVEIQSDFSIIHPDYKPLEIPEETRKSFFNLPDSVQQKYLNMQLRGFLYGIYYNGSLRQTLNLNSKDEHLPRDLENNTLLGIDVNFYEKLHENNQGVGYWDRGWQVIEEETEQTLVVKKGDLKLYIEREQHLSDPETPINLGELIAIKLPKNRIQNGFYLAVGNEGVSQKDPSEKTDTLVRIYWNFTPDGALAIMRSLTEQLNLSKIPFTFKVLYNPKEYQRDDSGVLYFGKQDYSKIRQILLSLYEANHLFFKPETPLFTLSLAEGLGLAEEPNHRFSEQESFGTHRCQIIANALLQCWYEGDNCPKARLQAIANHFEELGLTLDRVYLNSNSEDIYQF